MKKNCWLFLLFFISTTSYSQNWDLFPPTQKSLYSNFHGYEDIRIDSILIQGDTSTLFFNDRVRNGNCLSDPNMNFAFWGGYFLVPKSAIVTPKLTTFHCIKNGIPMQFVFKQRAAIGETWPIAQTNLYFKCESIVKGNVFGDTDSLKYFNVYEIGKPNPIYEYKFILSKNYGLIQFASISQLAFSDTIGLQKSTLLGFRKSGVNKGFVVPDFNDFFHLHAGDVLIWKHLVKDVDIRIPDKIFYYKDSILKALHTNDSALYTYSRSANSKIEIDSIYFLRKEFEDYFIQNPSHYVMTDKDPTSHFSFMGDDVFSHVRVEDIRILNGVTEINFDWSGWGHDKNDCSESLVVDVGFSFSVNTKVGLLSKGVYVWGITSSEVIGSIIDGVHSGITSIPTSIADIKNAEFSIYPNPAYTTITIQGNFNSNAPYKITNLQGQIVQEGFLSPSINIESLPKGLYYLQLEDKDSVSYTKFLKF